MIEHAFAHLNHLNQGCYIKWFTIDFACEGLLECLFSEDQVDG